MSATAASSILSKLWELQGIALNATTPDGRWDLLQTWLKANPTWAKPINEWLEMPSDKAYDALAAYAAEQDSRFSGLPATMIAIFIRPQAIQTIEVFQTLYKERKQLRKEIAT